ncbi:MAG: UDP-glucose--hexose-1-phosphate uridylyltransferase [Anaerolineae bacterium]|nr:UDP-glucose--hexose-1-phosphate uridylyltransferase [Anaerolineae bacterium]
MRPMNLSLPHRRYNPLTDEWILVSPQRATRPWLGAVERVVQERRPEYDPQCYLCPGNTRAGGAVNPPYTGVYVFDNDFPALLGVENEELRVENSLSQSSILNSELETGVCRVICFSPRHDLTLAELPAAQIRAVVDTWVAQCEELGARDDIAYVQLFENKGEMMGCSNPHPHCQVWATRHLPTIPGRKLASQERYFARYGSDLLGDYLALELRRGERLVCANEYWVALVPFWAVWPFETMLIPRRLVGDLPSLLPEERDALAEVIKGLTTRYDNLFRVSFPYSMGWHAKPTDGAAHPYWRLHAVYYPPLLRSATVRKFMVGYEMTAEPQRDITPEEAAARLRAVPERHYLEERRGS